MGSQTSNGTARFAGFELDLRTGELRKDGRRIRLQAQPLKALRVLLEHPGELVTREQLQKEVWPQDTFVDFDHGLNKAVAKLRDVIDESETSPSIIETLPRLGYRFVPQVEWVTIEPEPSLDSPQPETLELEPESSSNAAVVEQQPHGQAKGSRWWRGVGVVAALALAVGVAVRLKYGERTRKPGDPIRSLAVLPLQNLSGDPSQEYFADGMTDELITELARVPNLRVVSRTSVMQAKGSSKPLQQIARELNVDAIVEGSIVRSGDKVRITAQLIDVRNDQHLWAQSFEGQMSDILSLQDSVAEEIASQAKVALMPAAHSENRVVASIDPAAHDAYLRGRFFLNKRDPEPSARYFQQALSIDPAYASAYAGLSSALESQSLLEIAKPEVAMPKAIAAAKRALELDPENGEAYTALGGIETTYERNWAAAERDLTKGIELSPNDSLAELHYAIYLDAMNRPEEAVTHMRRALVLDPLSFFMTRHLGSVLFFARHYDEALFLDVMRTG